MFTQRRLLTPARFIEEAAARGLKLEIGHVEAAQRSGLLVPLYRVDLDRAFVKKAMRSQGEFSPGDFKLETLLGVVAVQQIHQALYEIFVESNTNIPLMGPKQWSRKLTPPQREVLELLPVVQQGPS